MCLFVTGAAGATHSLPPACGFACRLLLTASLSASLPICGIRRTVPRDLLLVEISDREEHRFGVDEIAALLAMVFEDPRFYDRIDRTRLLAEAAEDAFGEVAVIARGPAAAVRALLGLDG